MVKKRDTPVCIESVHKGLFFDSVVSSACRVDSHSADECPRLYFGCTYDVAGWEFQQAGLSDDQ